MAAPKFLLVKLQCLLFRPFGRVGHVALVRFFYTIHATGRTTADKHFAEEAAPLLVLQAVDGKYLLAIHLGQAKNLSDFIEAFLELALVEQHHHVRVVDDGLLHDFAANDVLYLLRHHADRSPELTGGLVHKLDVFRHERTGNGLPSLFNDKDFTVLLDAHFLQEHVHDNQCDNWKQFLVFLDGIHFKDDECLVKQCRIHILIENLLIRASLVERLQHGRIGRVADCRDVIFGANLLQTVE